MAANNACKALQEVDFYLPGGEVCCTCSNNHKVFQRKEA